MLLASQAHPKHSMLRQRTGTFSRDGCVRQAMLISALNLCSILRQLLLLRQRLHQHPHTIRQALPPSPAEAVGQPKQHVPRRLLAEEGEAEARGQPRRRSPLQALLHCQSEEFASCSRIFLARKTLLATTSGSAVLRCADFAGKARTTTASVQQLKGTSESLFQGFGLTARVRQRSGKETSQSPRRSLLG